MDPRRFLCMSAGGGEGGLFWLLLLEVSEDMMEEKGACTAPRIDLIAKSGHTQESGG